MQCLFRLEIGFRGDNILEWVPMDPIQWLTGFIFMSGECSRVTIRTRHVLLDWLLAVFWITNYVSTEWLGLAENARLIIIIICCVHIRPVCLVCSVGSTHTGPQRCVTLMIPYWSSLLKWHHHHYHSISRPLIGRLVTIQPSHWLIVSCGVTDTVEPGGSVTDARLRSLTVYILLSPYLCLTSNWGERTFSRLHLLLNHFKYTL